MGSAAATDIEKLWAAYLLSLHEIVRTPRRYRWPSGWTLLRRSELTPSPLSDNGPVTTGAATMLDSSQSHFSGRSAGFGKPSMDRISVVPVPEPTTTGCFLWAWVPLFVSNAFPKATFPDPA